MRLTTVGFGLLRQLHATAVCRASDVLQVRDVAQTLRESSSVRVTPLDEVGCGLSVLLGALAHDYSPFLVDEYKLPRSMSGARPYNAFAMRKSTRCIRPGF